MNQDIHDTGCQLLVLQETQPLFWKKVQFQFNKVKRDGVARQPEKAFIGVRGDEGSKENSRQTGSPIWVSTQSIY